MRGRVSSETDGWRVVVSVVDVGRRGQSRQVPADHLEDANPQQSPGVVFIVDSRQVEDYGAGHIVECPQVHVAELVVGLEGFEDLDDGGGYYSLVGKILYANREIEEYPKENYHPPYR